MSTKMEVCSACGQGIDKVKRSPVWVALLVTAFATSPIWAFVWASVHGKHADAAALFGFIAGAGAWHCYTLWRGNYKVGREPI
jgi:hypothetical protein